MSVYHSLSPSGSSSIAASSVSRNHRYPPQQSLYETKSSTNINHNQSLSPIMRDTSISSRELSLGGSGGSSSFLKSMPAGGSASPPTTINNNSYQNAIYVQKPIYNATANKYSRENTPLAAASSTSAASSATTTGTSVNMPRTNIDGTYGTLTNQMQHNKHAHHHHNILTSSETNLSKLFDQIHSTSSSNESVCSSSDLNLSSQHQQHYQKHQPLYGSSSDRNKSTNSGSNKQLNIWNDYGHGQQISRQQQQPIYNDAISSHTAANNTNNNNNNNNNNVSGFIPKKQQRGHKDDEIVKAKPYNIHPRSDNW